MLTRDERRASRRRGEAIAFDTLQRELAQAGPEGLESFADGMLDSCARMLRERISPDYAESLFADTAERLGRFARRESGT